MKHKTKMHAAAAALLLSTNADVIAQSYDPATQSPMSLLSSPSDPLAYFDARARVRSLLSENRAAEAEPLAEQVTREFPRDGENFILLGQVKRLLSKHRESAAAFERAGELLNWGGPVDSAVLAARAHLLAGNRRAALDLLRRHIAQEGRMDRSRIYDDEAFASLRSDPELLEIAGRPDTTGWSRDYGWRRDVDFVRDEVLRLNAEYRNRPLPPEFERRYRELKERVPQLSDEQIFVGMNHMLAVLSQGHTAVTYTEDSRLRLRGLPFQFWAFPEGIFIVAAETPHADLIGARLIAIGDVPAEEALRRVNETQSVDGDNEYLYLGPGLLRQAPFLAGLGMSQSTQAVRITVRKPGQAARTLTAATVAEPVQNRLMPLPQVPSPLYLRQPRRAHFEQPLPEHDALYLQVNLYDPAQAQVALRLRALLAAGGAPKNLILDMRFNDGGSTHLYAELLRTMIGFSLMPDRTLYVLTGRNTYSAAGNFITELEQLADAIFVGEASSECCTLYASPSQFILPFSRLRGRLSTLRWSLSRRSDDFRREMNPHVPVIMTAQDYFAGRDPVLDTVLRMIRRSGTSAPAVEGPN